MRLLVPYCFLLIGTDDVIVSGVLSAKWSPDLKDVRCDLDPMLIANHVRYMQLFSEGYCLKNFVIQLTVHYFRIFERYKCIAHSYILIALIKMFFFFFFGSCLLGA